MYLHDVTDWEWEAILPVIAGERACRRIAPPVLRLTVNGILWRMRTGRPWRFVPPAYGNWTSIRRRFQDWSEAGLWRTVTMELAEIRDRQWEVLPMCGPACAHAMPAAASVQTPPG